MKSKEFTTKNAKETEKLGGILAKEFSESSSQKAVVVGLEGELGAGKTTFVKGFAKDLGVKEKILSPTFVLIKNYRLRTINYKLLCHIDAYRLKNHRDLVPLGIKEILADPQNIVLIEWSDRVEKILPKKYIKIHIDHLEQNERKFTILNF
ncbi:MAG: UPF0079 ATP-binding protein [Parcubacteria group bacterium Gr01-1014_44]|nr:MAG: UPF0079 ATP-binding protein [Parcubacteria group bacterium Gr01-1014_44]